MDISKIFITIGIILLLLGMVLRFRPLSLGKLPGDILIKRKNSVFYFPITTLVILSVVFYLIIAVIRKF